MSPFAAVLGLIMIALFVFCFTLTVYMWYCRWKIKRQLRYQFEMDKLRRRQHNRVRQYRDRMREIKEYYQKTQDTKI